MINVRPVQGTVLKEPRHVVSALRFLVLVALTLLGLGQPPEHGVLFWTMTSIYGGVLVFTVLRGGSSGRKTSVSSIIFLFDVIAVSLLIILRGGEVQGFLMAYFALVLIAAIMEGLGNALVNAAVVSLVYTFINHWGASVEQLLSVSILGQFAFFLIIAILMGHMAAETRREAAIRRKVEDDRKRIAEELRNTSSNLRQSTLQLRRARDSLRANDRLATLGMLSAGIAHEMKNPIAAIFANIETAPELLTELRAVHTEGGDVEEVVQELDDVVDDCRHACRHLKKVVIDLNDMVRGREAVIQAIPPAESLQGAMRMLRKKAGANINVQVARRTERFVNADPGRLLQVLLNLAGNALDAMEEQGGDLTLSVEDAGPDRIAFLIEDSGPGIPPDVQERMWDPFMTTKEPGKGTGLGLHLVKEMVTSHHGTIECESTQGEGTRFRVELPAGNQEGGNDVQAKPSGAARRRRGVHPQGARTQLAG